ncbi:MAG: O-antigen ligase [Ignavibacteriales bacterium]|nr:O-antigen ligase [Ignavibacteriales bacterium]
MTVISFICISIFLLFTLSLFKKDSDIFSPARLFIIIWSMAIGLTELKFSRFQIQWTSYSWIMLFLSLTSMLIGMFIVYVINIDKPIKKLDQIRKSIINNSINSRLLFRYINILGIMYLLSFAISFVVIGYVPLFTSLPDVTRTKWGIFGFGLFIQSLPSILYLIILYSFIVKGELKRKIVLAVLFLLSVVTYLLLLQRYYIVFSLIISGVAIYYGLRKLKTKNVISIILILSFILYGVSTLRLSRYALNFLYYLSRMKFDVKYSIFTEPYMYVAMNLENFANAVNKLDRFSYGIFSFDFVLALTGLKHTLSEYLHIFDYPHLITNNYNTYTMFFIYYRDFGIIGLGFIPLFLGMAISTSYYKMRRNPNLNTISMYAICVFVILFSFFVPIISFLHFAFNLFLIYLITKLVMVSNTTLEK